MSGSLGVRSCERGEPRTVVANRRGLPRRRRGHDALADGCRDELGGVRGDRPTAFVSPTEHAGAAKLPSPSSPGGGSYPRASWICRAPQLWQNSVLGSAAWPHDSQHGTISLRLLAHRSLTVRSRMPGGYRKPSHHGPSPSRRSASATLGSATMRTSQGRTTTSRPTPTHKRDHRIIRLLASRRTRVMNIAGAFRLSVSAPHSSQSPCGGVGRVRQYPPSSRRSA